MAGLDAFEIMVPDAADLAAIAAHADGASITSIKDTGGLTLDRPWGTPITLTN